MTRRSTRTHRNRVADRFGTRRTAEALLRDIAFVLQVSRAVNRETPWVSEGPAGRRSPRPAAAGV